MYDMTIWEGTNPSGTNLAPTSPRLAYASTNKCPHPTIQLMVHTHPAKPATFIPVTFLKSASKIQPTKKNPPTLQKSVPLPTPRIAKLCRTADQRHVSMAPPNGPERKHSDLAPIFMNMLLSSWRHRLPPKSVMMLRARVNQKSAAIVWVVVGIRKYK